MLVIDLVVGIASVVVGLELPNKSLDVLEFVQVVESRLNDLVLVSAGIFFVDSLETRINRRRALDAINELRSLLRIVDVHQLTKDPHHVLSSAMNTARSPARSSDPTLLRRDLSTASSCRSSRGGSPPSTLNTSMMRSFISTKIGQKIILLQRQDRTGETSTQIDINSLPERRDDLRRFRR